MKHRLLLLLIAASLAGKAQTDSTSVAAPRYATYERHSALATVSVGFADDYRHNYSLPAGFEKGTTTGFTPFYAKLEYGLYQHISIAVLFSYDAFVYNYKQDYTGNNGPFARYRTDKARIFGGGLAAFYHLQSIIHIRHLDPFVGIGVSLNNIHHGTYPSGDTTARKTEHIVAPYLKVGARYYVSSKVSLFADAGYDKQSMVSLGISCRFISDRTKK